MGKDKELTDRELWKRQEKMYKLIESSFHESSEDEEYWRKNTDRLLKPSNRNVKSGWEVEYAKDKKPCIVD